MNLNDIDTRPTGGRRGLLLRAVAGVVFAALVATPAMAQDGDTVDQDAAAQDDDDTRERITVTGSRIQRPDYEFSNPVVSVDSEQLEFAGATNVTDFVQDLPALVNSFDSEDSAATGTSSLAGLNLLDLRNLGTNRTLVLVDGRRHVASEPGSSSIDVNTIPVALIERIEVLTGGASAIYGADGVTGVVNFVMKDDYEGVSLRGQHGWSDAGGGENSFVSALWGENFNDDKSNFTFGFEYSTTEGVGRDERSYSRLGNREVLVDNPNDFADDPNKRDLIFARDVRYIDTSPGGSVYTDFDFGDSLSGVDFQGNGDPWVDGIYSGGFTMIGGSGSLLDGFVDELLPSIDRYSFNSTFRHQFNPAMNFFAEAKYVNSQTDFVAQPTFDFFIDVPIDNAFIPATVLADATGPGGLGAIGSVFVARDNFDLGATGRDIERQTSRFVTGFEGDLFEGWNYELSYVFGRTDVDNIYTNDRVEERWWAAIDSVVGPGGEIVCRSDLDPNAIPANLADPSTWGTTFNPGPNSGCIPADIFGEDVSPEAANWINQDSLQKAQITQQVLQGFVAGDSGAVFSLPGGPIAFALGAEWRKEESVSRASEIELLSAELGTDITWGGQGSITDGEFDVTEIFGEFSAPIFMDKPWAQELTVDGALRISDYSTAGGTETWKYGGVYRPNDWLMFRGTQARAVRAPNIDELFLPQSQTFQILVDPCDQDNVNAGTGFRYDNCFTDLGFDPLTFTDTLSSSVEGRIGGNPDLEPEKADTTTYGVVFTPQRLIPGLTLSVDYWDIELSEAIQFFSAQTILDKCYDLPRPNDFCPLVDRDPATGLLSFFEQFAVNVAEYKAQGIDFSARYLFDPANIGIKQDIGTFAITLNATELEQLTFVELADAVPDKDVGEPGSPEWQAVADITWRKANWAVNYGVSWFSETDRISQERLAVDPDYAPGYENYSERLVHDLQVRYAADSGRWELYAGVNNMFDQEPDRGSLDTPVGPLGRFFYVGVSTQFDSIPFSGR